jgi:hypothetical protein
MKVICIDASKKPNKISPDEWLEEGVVYTVINAVNMGLQAGKIGLELKEVKLTERSFPYEYYDATRFLPIEGMIADAKVEEEEMELELDII